MKETYVLTFEVVGERGNLDKRLPGLDFGSLRERVREVIKGGPEEGVDALEILLALVRGSRLNGEEVLALAVQGVKTLVGGSPRAVHALREAMDELAEALGIAVDDDERRPTDEHTGDE